MTPSNDITFHDVPVGATNEDMLFKVFPGLELGENLKKQKRFFIKHEGIEDFDLTVSKKWLAKPYKR